MRKKGVSLDRLSIGEMASLNKVSEQTLRLYDKIGLLKPQIINEQTGYRYYTIAQSAVLDMIQYLKSSGLTLKQIQNEFSISNMEYFKAVLSARYAEIDKNIEELKQIKKSLARTLDNINRYETLPKNGLVFLEYCQPRKLMTYNTGINFFDQSYDEYEYALRNLKDFIIDKELPLSYFSNAGTIVRKEKLLLRELYSDEIFIFLDHDFVDNNTEIISGGTYLCICGSEFDKEKEYAFKLFDEINKNRYTICGDYICEVIAEFPANQKQRNFFYKIQIRIS